jgi:hypothetical protein
MQKHLLSSSVLIPLLHIKKKYIEMQNSSSVLIPLPYIFFYFFYTASLGKNAEVSPQE